MAIVAVYDACVLYSAPLRDLLLHLALLDLVHARWTDMIQEEWIRNVLASRSDLTRSQLDRTRALMDTHVRDGRVEGYESLIDNLSLPDPDDRHVLAAAIHAGAKVILTFNLRDFPDTALSPYGVKAEAPDTFVGALLDESPELVCTAARRQRSFLKNPPKSVEEYLAALERVGLPLTASKLRPFSNLLS